MTNTSKEHSFQPKAQDESVQEWQTSINTFLVARSDVFSKVKGIVATPHPLPSLPNEIISVIFNYISSDQHHGTLFHCALVNKQFNVNATRLLWETLLLDNDIETQRFLYAIRDATSSKQQLIPAQLTRSLVLASYAWNSTDLKHVLKHMPNLEHFRIDERAYISNSTFQNVASYCRHITTLQLHLYMRQPSASFSAIAKYCHSLTNLEYRLATGGSVLDLSLLEHCPSLEQLTLTYSDRTRLSGDNAVRAIQWLRHLTRLKLGSGTSELTESLLYCPTNNIIITTTTPTGIPWPRLQHLTLKSCYRIEDCLLIGFIKYYPTLQHLELDRSGKGLTDTFLDDMAPWLPNLTRLVLHGKDSGVPYGSIRRLINQCRHLYFIDIGGWIPSRLIRMVEHSKWTGNLESFLVNNDINPKFMGKLNSNQIDKIRKGELE